MKRMIKIIFGCLIVIVCAGILLALASMYAIYQGAKGAEVSSDTPAIVLGCRVKGEQPSRILGERIRAAYEYLESHPNAVAVLSGGQGENEGISEAECMYRELVQMGIDEARLYKEESSVNTPTNLTNSRAILADSGELDEQNSVVIITSGFHEYRGCYHAKQVGLTPTAYASKTALPYAIPFYFREVVAVGYSWIFRR